MDEQKVISAIKDILYMYKTLLDYKGLFSDFSYEYGDFDPKEFINCNLDNEYLYVDEYELNLLHEGCGIKLICSLIQNWEQGGYPQMLTKTAKDVTELLEKNRLDHIPEIRDVLVILIRSYDDAGSYFPKIYEKYVRNYYLSLCGIDLEKK